jgi:site-specific recombinase XerD
MEKNGEFVFYTKDGNPYSTVRLERIWRSASLKANKNYKTKIVNLYNGLKHSFGVQRLDEGYDLSEVQEIMGHKDGQSTRRYAEYSDKRRGGVMRGSSSQVVHSEEKDINSENQREKWSGREDLNLRHLTPHASALPGCATPRSNPWNGGVLEHWNIEP